MLCKNILSFTSRPLSNQVKRSGLVFLPYKAFSKTYYELLGLPKSASPEDIKLGYYSQAKKYHPDVSKTGTEKFKDINLAYETLSDEAKKREYDQSIRNFSDFSQKSEPKREPEREASQRPSYKSSASSSSSNPHPDVYYSSYWKGKGSSLNEPKDQEYDEGPEADRKRETIENIERMAEETAQSVRRKLITFTVSVFTVLVVLKAFGKTLNQSKTSVNQGEYDSRKCDA